MYSRFIHAITWLRPSFLFKVEKYSFAYLFIHLGRHLGCFYFFFDHCEQCSYDHQYTKILFESFLLFFFWLYTQKWNCWIIFDSMFNFLENCHTVFHSGYIILHCHSSAQGFWYRHILINTFFFLDVRHPNRCEVVSCDLICISWDINSVDHLYVCLLGICVSSLKKCLFKCLAI